MKISTRSLRRLLYVVAAIYLAACVIAWPYLPEQIPLHFGFSRRVSSWATGSAALWFLLPTLAVAITALILAVSGPAEAWKLSDDQRKRVRRLPEDARLRIMEVVDRNLLIMLMFFLTTFMSLQVGIFMTAVAQAERMPIIPWAAMMLAIVGAVVAAILGQRLLSSQIRSESGQAEL